MNETENSQTTDIRGDLSKMKATPKTKVDSGNARTPFRDIGNKSGNLNNTSKEKVSTPSKYEVIRSLDDEENWRDRTEVVTKFEHTAYKLFAREIIEETIEKLPTPSNCPQTPAKPEFPRMAFREPNAKSMDDSVLDETINLPHLDTTLNVPDTTLNIPVANSTFVSAEHSNPATPNGSNTVLECSLLSSFEKMKLEGVKEQGGGDDEDDDIFHDASDDFTSFSVSPSKTKENEHISQTAVEPSIDPMDLLMSSLEKITVSDDSHNTDSPVRASNETKLPASFLKSKGILPGEGNELPVQKDQVIKDAERDVSPDIKGNFKDPSFNPFLIGTPDESTKSEISFEKAQNEVSSTAQITAESKLNLQNSPRELASIESKAEVDVLSEKKSDIKEALTEVQENKSDTQEALTEVQEPAAQSKDPTSIVENPPITQIPATKEIDSKVSGENDTKHDNNEVSKLPEAVNYDFSKLAKADFDPFAPHSLIVNSPDLVSETENKMNFDDSKAALAGSSAEETGITPPPKTYDMDKVLKSINDPTINPFESKSCIVNSPDLQLLAEGGSKDKGNAINYAVHGLAPLLDGADVVKKRYSIELAPHLLKDPSFDPFASRDVVSNSPDLVNEGAKSLSCILNNPVKDISENEAQSKDMLKESQNGEERTLLNTSVTLATVANSPLKKLSAQTEEAEKAEEKLTSHEEERVSLEKDSAQEELVPDVKMSPKRKYEEAFLDEDDIEELTATDGAGNGEAVCNTNVLKLEGDNALESQEEIIPPKKEYNLEFLDALDDPNFNPFVTKTAVSNSPDKKNASFTKETDSSLLASKTSPKEKNTIPEKDSGDVAVGESKQLSSKTEDEPEKEVPGNLQEGSVTSQESTMEETSQCVNPNSGDSKDEGQNRQASVEETEEEVLVPKKGYQLDFLDNLDDPNFNPFATKTAVVNSPEKPKGDAESVVKPNIEKSCNEVQEEKPKDQDSTKTVPKNVDKTNASKPKMVKKNVRVPLKKKAPVAPKSEVMESEDIPDKKEDEEEIPVPKKGYQLDFLDNLDDPNFNPFATKTAVTNSPEKPEGNAKSVVKANDEKIDNKGVQEEKSKDQDSTKTEPQTDNKASASKQKLVKKNVRVPLKKKLPIAPKVEVTDSEDKSEKKEGDEEEVPVPKKEYQLDFLDNLDDPSFNPFATKAAVSNSPKKNESSSTEVKSVSVEDKDALKVATKPAVSNSPKKNESPSTDLKSSSAEDKDALKVGHESQEKELKEKLSDPMETEEPLDTVSSEKVNKTKVETSIKPEAQSSLKEEEKLPSQLEEKEAETPVPKNEYQLDLIDNFDDPNYNPFATKCSVSNSPQKSDSGPQDDANTQVESKQETSVDESLENPASKSKNEKSKTETMKTKPPANTENCPPPTNKFPLPVEHFSMFDMVAHEALKLSEVSPSSKRQTEIKAINAPIEALQRDVFSPLQARNSRALNTSANYNFEEFVNATDFTAEKQEEVEGEVFHSSMLKPLFNNPEDLDILSEHGKDGDKLNLVRNSLYVKFDPLVSGRQSLAPYLAQQRMLSKEEEDPRRESALMCFSPSPDKNRRGENPKGSGTPVRPLVRTKADETAALDATTNMTVNETTVCEGHNATVVGPNATVVGSNSGTTFNTTIVSEGGLNVTLLQDQPILEERMIPESEMLKKIKEMEQRMHLVIQNNLLRQSCVLEETQKRMKQQAEESEVALNGMEDENQELRFTIKKLQDVMAKLIKQQELKNEQTDREKVLMENKYELQCKALKQESLQHQEELKKMEVPFYDLVKKYSRLQEITESMRRNEEMLKTENENLVTKLAKKEEDFDSVFKTLEENYNKAQQEFQVENEKHEHEKAKLFVLIKKAEVKIISLQETVEKKTSEIQRLTTLIDDITKKFG